MSKEGKFLARPQRRSRICPVCGKKFDAKNSHISMCSRCKTMWDRSGRRRKGSFE